MIYRQAEIEQWGIDRGLYEQSSFDAQFEKLMEEATELFRAVRLDDRDGVIDAIGDCTVVIVHLFKLRPDGPEVVGEFIRLSGPLKSFMANFIRGLGYAFQPKHGNTWLNEALCCLADIAVLYGTTIEACIDHVLPIINARTGRFVDGIWLKDAK